jgi:3-isopropylmalate/(R)-2-methylmalate dehydratase large subunit
MAGKTVIEKILSRAAGRDVEPLDRVWVDVDLAVVRDFGGPNVVLEYEKHFGDTPPADPAKIAMTFDYQAPAKVTKVAENQAICRKFAAKHGIESLYDVNRGIGQHVLLEDGRIHPGQVVVGTDSHMNLLGAVNCFATGCGTTDLVAAWRTGRLWFKCPPTLKVVVTGEYSYPTSAKDLTLFLINKLGTDLPNYRAIEFSGEAIDNLGVAGRLTLASLMTEINAKIAFFPPSAWVDAWLEGRLGSRVEPLTPDHDAGYRAKLGYSVDGLRPLVALPHYPTNALPAGAEGVAGKRITSAFIGSCTNGRIEDFRDGAEALTRAGGKVHPGVMLTVVPSTAEVALQMLEEGLYDTYMRAGAMVTNPGCSLCTIGHHGVLAPGDVLVSTSNRNFEGKLGRGAEIYLASPATAAASAARGVITDPSTL